MKYDESMLSALIDGELSDAEMEIVQKQLASSSKDRELLESLRDLHEKLTAVPEEVFSTDPVEAVRAKISERQTTGLSPTEATETAAPAFDETASRTPSDGPTPATRPAETNPAEPHSHRGLWTGLIVATAASLIGVGLWLNADSGALTTAFNAQTDSASAPRREAAATGEAAPLPPAGPDGGGFGGGGGDVEPQSGERELVENAVADEPPAAMSIESDQARPVQLREQPPAEASAAGDTDKEDAGTGSDRKIAMARGANSPAVPEPTASNAGAPPPPSQKALSYQFLKVIESPDDSSDDADQPNSEEAVSVYYTGTERAKALRYLLSQVQNAGSEMDDDSSSGAAATGGRNAADPPDLEMAREALQSGNPIAVYVEGPPQQLADLIRSLQRVTLPPETEATGLAFGGGGGSDAETPKATVDSATGTQRGRDPAAGSEAAGTDLPLVKLGVNAAASIRDGRLWILLK